MQNAAVTAARVSLGLTPYLFYDDPASMLEWYATAFGWVEIGRWLDEHGRVRNAEMADRKSTRLNSSH